VAVSCHTRLFARRFVLGEAEPAEEGVPMADRGDPDRVLSPAETDQLGVLAARPLSEPAAQEIRRALAEKVPGGRTSSGRRGPASGRGGAATGSVAAPPPSSESVVPLRLADSRRSR